MRDHAADRVLELVLKHGWNATSFQVLGSGFSYFLRETGCVAYVDTGRAWVAAGAPIGPSESLAELARSFSQAAHREGRRCCFFGTETRFLRAARETHAIRIGEQPVWDPELWPTTLSRHASLREQLRRARAKGVRVRRLEPGELESPEVRSRAARLVERWQASHAMPAMGFLVRVEPFAHARQRCVFVAEQAGALVGLASVIPVPARNGWFVEHLVRSERAPNGSAETLVDAVMTWSLAARCSWLTLGLAPLSGDVALALRVARRRLAPLYDFAGLRGFRAKLRPLEWMPIHVSFPASQGPFVSLVDTLRAFTSDGLLRFGWQTLLRASDRAPAMLPSGCGQL